VRVLFDATVLCGGLVNPAGVNYRLLRLAAAGGPLDGFTTEVAGYEFVYNALRGIRGVQYESDEIADFLDSFAPLFDPARVAPSSIGRAIIDQVWMYERPVGEVVWELTGRSVPDLLQELEKQQRVAEHDFDPADLHLLVAAIESSADALCTSNTTDFRMERVGTLRVVRPGVLWAEATDPT
jgi:predicted nucleic acid-binding protein